MANGIYLWNLSIPNLANDLLLEDILDKMNAID